MQPGSKARERLLALPPKLLVTIIFVGVLAWSLALASSALHRHAVGVLPSDHVVGPLSAGESLGQTFAVRFDTIDRAAIHLLPLTENAGGTVELALVDAASGEVLAIRYVHVGSLARDGSLVEVLQRPVTVDSARELEVRVSVPHGEAGGVGSAALSGNPLIAGRAIRDGVAFESDLVFVVESSGGLPDAFGWLGHRAKQLSGYGSAAPGIAVAAAVLVLVGTLVVLLAIAPSRVLDASER